MAKVINYAGNTYSGEVHEDLLAYLSSTNDAFREGLIHIKPGVQMKYVLPHMFLGSIIQDNVATPTSTQGQGGNNGENQYTFSERYLEPQGMMVYMEFNPRDFESLWKPFQPDGQLVFRELDPKVQSAMLRALIDRKNEYLGDCIWAGRKGGVDGTVTVPSNSTQLGGVTVAGPMKYFDGALTRCLVNLTSSDANEKATGKVVLAGNTELTTGEQVEQALYAMWRQCSKNVRKSKDLKFVMGWDAWNLYDQYLSAKNSKYSENTDENKYRFKGKRVVVVNGMPEHTIFLGKFTNTPDSCLWMGVDYATDQESVKVERLQANSELFFFQMRLKVDVNIVLPSEITLWTAYKKS